MSTIIRATDKNRGTQCVAYNLDDMATQADSYLGTIRQEAAKIVAAAADELKATAQQEGRQAALEMADKIVAEKLASLMPAMQKIIEDIGHAKQAWLTHWEKSAVHVAAAIANRVIRRELPNHPEVTLTLVREALELAVGSSRLEIHLNPDDLKALGVQVEMIVKELSPLAETELVADENITPGGCRVETQFGSIDQQFEAQLKRIEEELT
jgi:flagellar assembly protein FliH